LNNGNSHPMRVALERLEQEWGGQALYNRLEGNALRDQSNFYMTLPLRWQGRLENAEVSISWRRDNRSKGAIPNNLTVNVGLNTVNLGAVIFHLRTQGKQLGLSIYLENEVVKSQVDQQIPELITQLTNMGYDTSFMGSQVVKQPNLRPEFIDEVSNDNLPPVTGLDLKI
ncbi:MAG: flagellar hook-length control protein FliK, partial [Methylocystaceae bacterium]